MTSRQTVPDTSSMFGWKIRFMKPAKYNKTSVKYTAIHPWNTQQYILEIHNNTSVKYTTIHPWITQQYIREIHNNTSVNYTTKHPREIADQENLTTTEDWKFGNEFLGIEPLTNKLPIVLKALLGIQTSKIHEYNLLLYIRDSGSIILPISAYVTLTKHQSIATKPK